MFAIIALDHPGSGELRAATRERHLAYARSRPELRIAGPFLDDDGSMVGSLFLLDVDDRAAAAEAFAADDPYGQAGLFASVDIRPWRAVITLPVG